MAHHRGAMPRTSKPCSMHPIAFRKLTPFTSMTIALPTALVRLASTLTILTLTIQTGLTSAQAQQISFPVTTLQTGMHIIQAEVADDMPRRMQGLMFRKELPGNQGMVFAFERSDAHCMWMKNTFVPLTVAFLDDNGTILNLADMQPQSETNHCAKGAARYALEMRQGWFAQKGVKEGDRIEGVNRLKGR